MNILAKMIDLITYAYTKNDLRNAEKNLPPNTNIGKLFAVAAWGFELIKDNAELVRQWAHIDHAKGAALDRHGENYGVKRGGASDLFYRLLIKVKIISQLSGGDIDTVISAIATLYGVEGEKVSLEEIFPAKLKITLNKTNIPEGYLDVEHLINLLIKRIIAAGIGYDIWIQMLEEFHHNMYAGARVTATFSHKEVGVPHDSLDGENINGNIYFGGAVTCSYFYTEITEGVI